jgi:NADPH:quinone reductase-like Zn-dependent oxidoreductase
MSLPTEMQALVLYQTDGSTSENLRLETRPVPQSGPGQVLVQMEATPVNPSDVMFLSGRYGLKKALPVVPGLEGAGTVVASGGGALASLRNGRRVACFASDSADGTWAQYMVTDATRVIPVGADVPAEQAATALVNPLTALALLELARQHRARAIVSTAAASQVGRMLLRLANARGVPAVHIVRRDEQVTLLRELGGQHVLNSTSPTFEDDLRSITRELKATVLFDAVAGELTYRVLGAMPSRSVAYVYGGLSMAPVKTSLSDLIFKSKEVRGFWLARPTQQLSRMSLLRVLWNGRRVLRGDDLTRSEIRGRYSLDDAPAAIADYAERMSAGKVIITPNG